MTEPTIPDEAVEAYDRGATLAAVTNRGLHGWPREQTKIRAGLADAIAALAEAGWTLLPPGAETNTSWNTRFLNPSGQPVIDPDLGTWDRSSAEDSAACFHGDLICHETRTWPDGSEWTGPWQTVASPPK